jgi:hypothetical protein
MNRRGRGNRPHPALLAEIADSALVEMRERLISRSVDAGIEPTVQAAAAILMDLTDRNILTAAEWRRSRFGPRLRSAAPLTSAEKEACPPGRRPEF